MSKKSKVLIGLSGGVDSAVAALLLQQQGYTVIGAFMKNFSDTKNPLTNECNYLEDLKDARKIAALLDIPLKVLDFEKQYKKNVINPMFESYARGLTPNPDSQCNKLIKFPLLWKHAKKLKCDFIATGHYIQKTKNKNSNYLLKIPKDISKDQSYFLYDLTQKDLSHTLFPISNLTKSEVRKLAAQHKFPNANKHSTRGICFIGKINMKNFLKQKIKPKPGTILNPEYKEIGTHQGTMFYTIGERVGPRSGIIIDKEYHNQSQKRLYISSKNNIKNTITIAPHNHPTLYNNSFNMIKVNWINQTPTFPLTNVKVRIRHLGELIPATISSTKKNNIQSCTLKKPIKGLAEGQSCVFYQKHTNIVLGGGEIRFH